MLKCTEITTFPTRNRIVVMHHVCTMSLQNGKAYHSVVMPQHALSIHQQAPKEVCLQSNNWEISRSHEQTQKEVFPIYNAHVIISSLKDCSNMKKLSYGLEIHAEIARLGILERDSFVCTSLVDMYVKCASSEKAQEVFDELPLRTVVSWNALISGYVENGNQTEALNQFKQMQVDGVLPNAVTSVCILKAFGQAQALRDGQELHVEIERNGLLDRNPYVRSALISMYTKCGLLSMVHEIFDRLDFRDTVSWTTLISGYAEHGSGPEAIKCFDKMQLEGICANASTYVTCLKACSSICRIDKGREIHCQVEEKGLIEKNIIVASTLIDMYAKCGLIDKARYVFNRLPEQNVISWTSLITGYAVHGLSEEAVVCFEQMQVEHISPNAVTFVSALKACGSMRNVQVGQEIHAMIERQGFLHKNIFIGSSLVDMYSRCGMLLKAQEVFDTLPCHDIILWNSLITGYVNNEYSVEALSCYEKMQLEGVSPNTVTFVCCLKACGNIRDIKKAEDIYNEIERKGMLIKDVIMSSTLIDTYIKCGLLSKARQLFNKLVVRDVVSWTSMIAGHVEQGFGREALDIFEEMLSKGIAPDPITLLCGLKASASMKDADKGQEMHVEIERRGLLEKDPVFGSSLIDMYAKCNNLSKAQQVFDQLPLCDVVAWTALITSYTDHEYGDEALQCFEKMQVQRITPNGITLVSVLKACINIGATDMGLKVHTEIEKKGLLEQEPIAGSTLVDMYAKFGSLTAAQQIFNRLPVRDVVSWNALISGCAQLGQPDVFVSVLDRMIDEGVRPDPVTLIVLLNACNLTGQLSSSHSFFEVMSQQYGITPTVEHHACMIDLLGRTGELEEAVAMIEKMPYDTTLVIWRSLLIACKNWGNASLAKHAFEQAIDLDSHNSAAYVLMAHTFATTNEKSVGTSANGSIYNPQPC